jgi:hypothetical protein
MKAWEHGHEWWSGGIWFKRAKPDWASESVYRAKPAPVEPERVTRWVNVYPSGLGVHREVESAKTYAGADCIALWRITYDEDTGLNPVIELKGEQDDNR